MYLRFRLVSRVRPASPRLMAPPAAPWKQSAEAKARFASPWIAALGALGLLLAIAGGCNQKSNGPGQATVQNGAATPAGGSLGTDPASTEPPALPAPTRDPTESKPTDPPDLTPSPLPPPTLDPARPGSTEPPSTEPPSTEPPSTEPPSTEPPSTEPPSTEPPSTEPPSTVPPSTVPPSAKPPSAESPPSNPQPPAGSPSPKPGSDGLAGDPDKLFEGWEQPRLVLLISGQQHGYIEPCGCTGLTNQKGGLARRRRLQKEMLDKGWTVFPVDAGNQVRRFGRQAEIKFQMTVEAMKTMGYQAVAFGPDDLNLSTGELIAVTTGDGDQASPFVCANVALIDRSLTPEFRVIEAQGLKIGVTAVLGDSFLQTIQGDEVIREPAEEGLARVWPQLEAAKCDLYVLLAHATLDQSRALAKRFPRFDLVVSAGGAGEPTRVPEAIPDSDAVMVQCGTKGMFAGVVGVFDDPKTPLRYQRVPLDARFEDAPEMLKLLAAYQQQLESDGLERLGVRPIPHPSGRRFVGSDTCADCHSDAYDIWKESPHAHATDSLVHPGERTEIARHFDPECLSCHVTGWNPQKFFPYESGYLSLQATPMRTGSGCENCHGPGDRHVAAESGDVEVERDELLKLRKEMQLPLATARQTCLQCHDLDNSPDFHAEGAFETYWDQVAH
jgi:hypothetical protein